MHTRRRNLFYTLALLFFAFPTFAYAALININTASVTLLDELPGIGPVKATAIVDYRNANGPFARIEDIQNVSGIGPSTYAEIEPLITVGDTSTPSSDEEETASSTPSVATSTESVLATPPPDSGPAEYLPIPSLRIVTDDDRIVSSGADTAFTAAVYDGKGNKRDDAIISWSFGDGMRRVGSSVFHAYYEAGEYAVIVQALTSDGGNELREIVITVKDAKVKIASVSSRGITLANNDLRALDLSLWRLSMGGQEFKIPENTWILAGKSTLFPSQVIELPVTGPASLLYPSGEVAVTYPLASGAQLSVASVSSNVVQTVEPIISTRTTVQEHEDAVSAPTAVTELAAVGAALDTSSPEPVSTPSPILSLIKSPWALGSLGVVILASAAFILL